MVLHHAMHLRRRPRHALRFAICMVLLHKHAKMAAQNPKKKKMKEWT